MARRKNSHPLLLLFGSWALPIRLGMEKLWRDGFVNEEATFEEPEGIEGHLDRLQQFPASQTASILEHYKAEHFAPEGYYIP